MSSKKKAEAEHELRVRKRGAHREDRGQRGQRNGQDRRRKWVTETKGEKFQGGYGYQLQK